MAITLGNGLNITAKESVDARIIKSKEEMKNMTFGDKLRMPDIYFCICSDDKKLYIYDANATESETGKFRSIEEFINFTSTPQAKENIDEAIRESETIADITDRLDHLDGGEVE